LVHKDHKITQTNKKPLTLSDEQERPLQYLDENAQDIADYNKSVQKKTIEKQDKVIRTEGVTR
jgi:hypothetical protein